MPGLRERFASLIASPSVHRPRDSLETRIAYPDLDPAPTLDGSTRWQTPDLVSVPPRCRATRPASSGPTCSRSAPRNRADYYDPRNSFLNDVLERRTDSHLVRARHRGRLHGSACV
jgi:hypothetical protein